MADLSYSVELLTGLGRELRALAGALEGTARSTRWDDEEVGHRAVSDALDDFATSWDDRRELLTRALGDVGTMAVECADTFRRVDDELATGVQGILESR